MWRFPLAVLILLFSARPEITAQSVHLDFAKGKLVNAGTLGGTAVIRQPSEGDFSGIIKISQVSVSQKWQALFTMAANGTQGAHLALPGSEEWLRLDQPTGALSISFWLNWNGPDAHEDNRQIIVSTESDNFEGWGLGLLQDGKLIFSWMGIDGVGSQRNSERGLNPGEWHHVTVTWQNGEENALRFYLDGESVETSLAYTGKEPVAKSSSEIVIGCGRSYLPMNGKLADFRLYDRVLKTTEITKLSRTGNPGGTKP